MKMYSESIDQIFVIGPPGCGKTTFSKLLAQYLLWSRISGGEMANLMAEGSDKIKSDLAAGELAPKAEMDRYFRSILSTSESVIFDGFPRYDAQFDMIDKERSFLIVLELPFHISMSRIQEREGSLYLRQREERRQHIYVESTLPMILNAVFGSEIVALLMDATHTPDHLLRVALYTMEQVEADRANKRTLKN